MNEHSAAQPQKASTPVHGGVLERKCACGNHMVAGGECAECSQKKRMGLQTKLTVSEPGDIYEQEADRIADQVMATSGHSGVSSVPSRIQRFSGQPTGQTEAVPASVDQALAGLGSPLEPALRRDMEQRFGYDFSRVRVHTGTAAEQSARDVNAHAYTVRHNMVFGHGQFAPGTHEGRRLIAHELTHVMQQSGVGEMHYVGQSDEKGLSVSSRLAIPSDSMVQRACGEADIRAAVAGRATHVDLGDPGVTGTLVQFRVGCDEFLTSADESTLSRLRSVPVRTRIIIHGFASEEGPPMFNLLLSQARAEKAKDILSRLLDPAQIERAVMHGAVPGARPDRRSVIIETKGALPLVTKTLNIVSWISGKGLPDFSKSNLALAPPTIRVLEAACMALKCTANPAPPAKLPASAVSTFLASKQYRAFQAYTITYIPSTSARGIFFPAQVVGFTAPSSCSDVPPTTFQMGEVSPLNHATPDMSGTDPKAEALMKFRVSAAEESAAIGEATSFPGSVLFSKSMLRHVPWVWTQTSLRLEASTGLLNWSVQGSAFPTHTIYLDGTRVAEISQGPCGVVIASRFRTADMPRQAMAEEAKQASVPISAQDETVDPGGTASGTG